MKGDTATAVEKLGKNKSAEAQYQLALLQFQRKEYKKALKISKKLSKQDELSTNVGLGSYLIQVLAYTHFQKDKKVEKTYDKAFEKFPLHYLLYFNYGMKVHQDGNLKLAEEHIQKSILLNPAHAEGHRYLSLIQEEKGQRIKAILPLYAYLIYSTEEQPKESVMDSLQNLLYKGIEVVQENGLSFTLAFSKEDADENPNLQALELVLNDLNHNTPGIPENEVDKFRIYTHSIFRFMSENHRGEDNIWWGLYGRLLNDMHDKKYVDAFIYSLFHEIDRKNPPKAIEKYENWKMKLR